MTREELDRIGLGIVKTIPYRYQLHGPRDLAKFRLRGILADGMGLGKSLQVLICREKYLKTTGPTVIVCPASIKYNWQRECEKHMGWRAVVLEGMTPPKDSAFIKREGIFVLNYDILGPADGPRKTWNKFLKALYPALVVFDEGHYLINREAKRTKAALQLVEDVPHVLVVTGTPVTSKPINLFAMLRLTRPDLFPSFYKFAQRYCAPRLTPWGWDYSGSSNLRELHGILKKKVMVRRTTEEVMKDLPPLNRVMIPVQLTPAGTKEYLTAENDFIAWLRKTAGAGTANRARNAERLVKAGYLKRLAAKLKLPSAKDWIDDQVAGGQKVIVFGIGREDIVDALHTHYRKVAVKVTGGVKGRLRQAAFDAFNQNPAVRLLFANMHAGGTGNSVTGSNISLFVEMDWNPGTMAQAEKRNHGVGRGIAGLPTFAYYLIARGTIDERLVDIWATKQNTIDQIIDGKESTGDDRVMDLLEASYLRAGKSECPNPYDKTINEDDFV